MTFVPQVLTWVFYVWSVLLYDQALPAFSSQTWLFLLYFNTSLFHMIHNSSFCCYVKNAVCDVVPRACEVESKSKWRCSTFQLFEMFAFKKKKRKKMLWYFCFSLLFLSFFFKKNTFKGAGGWWRRHNVTTRELWIQCSSGFATVSFVSIAAIFCDKLLEHYFTCDFRLWYFCFSSLHAIAAYSFVQTPWDG